MILPEYIKDALNSQIKNVKMSDILKARENLTLKYKSKSKHQNKIVNSNNEVIAYLLSRLPSTYAVVDDVLNRADFSECKSLLDLGSGPGTVLYAALENLDTLEKITLVEQEKAFIQKINEISNHSDNSVLKKAEKLNRDVLNIDDITKHDLVTVSYVFNELSDDKQEKLINKLWEKANKFIVIIETGTPEGYQNILKARKKLIELGGSILAPCPHNLECPLVDNDWCHFSQRVERTSEQRFLKEGTESFEDEKFSYIIVSKENTNISNEPRIIRHPQILKGHIDLQLCTNQGIKNITVSKKDDNYKKTKKLDWGDSLDFSNKISSI